MQTVLTQLAASDSRDALTNFLAGVPKSERVTLLLSLFLQTQGNLKARHHVFLQFISEPSPEERIGRQHLLLMTQAYLFVVKNPGPYERPNRTGLNDSQEMCDRLFFEIGLLAGVSLEDMGYKGGTGPFLICQKREPTDSLARLLARARQNANNTDLSAEVQACENAVQSFTQSN